jgi:hypothetical protein
MAVRGERVENEHPKVFASVAKSAPNLTRMLLSLSWAYLTLGWQVRKAKKAFETQLLLQGMSKHDTERLSSCYDELKKNILTAIKQNMSLGFQGGLRRSV